MANPANLYAPQPEGRTANIERDKAGKNQKPEPSKIAASYWREIERYNRSVKDWHTQGDNIERLYLEEDRTQGSTQRRLALLWANVETLKPAVYAKVPTILCDRRYKDRDPVGRIAAELMERAANTSLDLYNADETFKLVRDDRLLPGRGQAWVRYEATIAQYPDEEAASEDGADAAEPAETESGMEPGAENGMGEGQPGPDASAPAMNERIAGERVCVDYVHWKDFGHNVAPCWNEVWLVWRRTYKTKDEVIERFGKEIAAKLSYNDKMPGSGDEARSVSNYEDGEDDRCRIYELWDKRRNIVSWMTEDLKTELLDTGEPPVNFSGFFPCPSPCYATKTSKKLIPKADYLYYRDQAKEINDLTEKIGNLMGWLIVKGFTPGAPSGVADAIDDVTRDKSNRELFVEVPDAGEWSDAGGIAKLIDWLPLDMIIKALQAAISARNQLIQDVFQITGISDILRGQTNPNETLGAQELKAQTGSRRLRNTKDEVARFCRDIGRLVAEVIAEKFQPQTIAEMTGYKYIPPAPPPIPLPLAGRLPTLLSAATGAPEIGGAPGMLSTQPGQTSVPPMMPRPPLAQTSIPVGLNGAGGAPVAPNAPGAPMPPAMPLPPSAPPQAAGMGIPGPMAPMSANGASQPFLETPDGRPTFDDRVMALLRDDRMRSFRIDIETDSTTQTDENAEKQRRTEFAGAVSGFMDKMTQAVQLEPEIAPLAGELLGFIVRGFRVGRSLEDQIERTFAAIAQRAQARQAQGPAPSPEAQKAQIEADAAKQDAARSAQEHAQKMAQSQQAHEQNLQVISAKAAGDLQVELERRATAEAQRRMLAEQHAINLLEMDRQAALKAKEAEIKFGEFADRAAEREHRNQIAAAKNAAPAALVVTEETHHTS